MKSYATTDLKCDRKVLGQRRVLKGIPKARQSAMVALPVGVYARDSILEALLTLDETTLW